MNLRLSFACVLTALLASCAPQFMIAAQYGPITPTGDIGVTTGGGSGNQQNSLGDLGLDGAADTAALVGDFKWGSPHLTVGLQQSSWSGSGRLGEDYGGITAGTQVHSDADLGLYRGVCTFDLLPTDLVELGIGFGVSVVDLKAKTKDTGGTIDEKIDQVFPLPLLAARGGFRIWRIDVQAIVAGISGSTGGDNVTYFEGDLNGRFSIFGRPGETNGSIVLGWHRTHFNADYKDGNDDVEADLTFDGPYLGFQIGI
jgi:hypothetical protein